MPDVDLPDVEALVIAFAKTKTTATVRTKTPNPRPALYARIWRTGGGAVNRVLEQAQITITCGDGTGALKVAQDLRHAFLNDYTEMPLVRGVEEVTGPYFDPDPDTNADRYSFTLRLSVRGRR